MATDVMQNTADFEEFARKIQRRSGLDLLAYKQNQVQRRLNSLRERKGYPDFRSFYAAMERDPSVYDDFMNQLTINVTEFYRNPSRWDVLCQQIVPNILQHSNRIRCWSAACSTGEEPYSLVMALSKLTALQNIDVLATDLDGAVVAKAKTGRFTADAVKTVPPADLKQFFRADGEAYQISEAVKQRVQFRQHDLLADPYGYNFDLIVCRNVLIYFKEEAKGPLYHKFHNALKPGGYLFVGATEQILHPEQYGLRQVTSFFYQRVTSR